MAGRHSLKARRAERAKRHRATELVDAQTGQKHLLTGSAVVAGRLPKGATSPFAAKRYCLSDRVHHHYLKGTIFCGEYGTRLVFSRHHGNGGTYDYYLCLSRTTKRRPCSRTVIRLNAIETAIARFYRSFQLSPVRVEAIRESVRTELRAEQTQAEQDQTRARHRIAALTDQRSKLLADDLLSSVSIQTALTGEPTGHQNDTPADTANRARPSAVLRTVITSKQAHKAPQQDLLGRGLHNVRLVCPRWGSNPH